MATTTGAIYTNSVAMVAQNFCPTICLHSTCIFCTIAIHLYVKRGYHPDHSADVLDQQERKKILTRVILGLPTMSALAQKLAAALMSCKDQNIRWHLPLPFLSLLLPTTL